MQRVKELFYKGIFDNKTEKEIYKLARGIDKQVIHETILEMLSVGDLVYATGNKLRVPYLEGKIQGHRRGFAFFIPDNGGQDLFIKQENLGGAVHGDSVLAKKIGGRKGDEGCIIKVLKRNTTLLVGQYNYSKFGGRVTPDDNSYAQDIYIEKDSKAAVQGEKVVVKITKQLENGTLYGTVEKILGFCGELTVEENALIEQSQLPQEFAKNCLAYADRVANEPISTENRLDLREKLCITIDGDDSRDYDDAITLEREGDGYLLGVHIADVTHYVKRGDPLDNEAYDRGTSVYFPDRVLPMLPKQLSNGACSLNANEDKYTLSCLMHIDSMGNVKNYQIANTVIRSKRRMTYKQVAKIVAGDATLQAEFADIVPLCMDFAALTKLFIAKRKAQGSIDLDLEESQITVQGEQIDIVRYERTFAHRMIEEAMVLANETVAQFVEEKGYPFVYRVQEQPSREKAASFATFLQSMGIQTTFDLDDVQPQDYANTAAQIQDEKLQTVVHKVMLRSMSKARYSHSNCGHFGLASKSYAHFTSPIRRYPDLLIHRIIKHILKGEVAEIESFKTFVEKASIQCSLRERRAEECERNVDELYKVFYMQAFVGQTFQGTISGVTNFAIFVELENSIEGHIKIENLPEDSYTFIEEKFLLKGNKNSYAIGDSIEIKVMRCDIGARKIEFLPVGVDLTERAFSAKRESARREYGTKSKFAREKGRFEKGEKGGKNRKNTDKKSFQKGEKRAFTERNFEKSRGFGGENFAKERPTKANRESAKNRYRESGSGRGEIAKFVRKGKSGQSKFGRAKREKR